MAEERIGWLQRQRAYDARAREDAAYESLFGVTDGAR